MDELVTNRCFKVMRQAVQCFPDAILLRQNIHTMTTSSKSAFCSAVKALGACGTWMQPKCVHGVSVCQGVSGTRQARTVSGEIVSHITSLSSQVSQSTARRE